MVGIGHLTVRPPRRMNLRHLADVLDRPLAVANQRLREEGRLAEPGVDRLDAETNVSGPSRLSHSASALAASGDRTIVSVSGDPLLQVPLVVKCCRALPSWFSAPLNSTLPSSNGCIVFV